MKSFRGHFLHLVAGCTLLLLSLTVSASAASLLDGTTQPSTVPIRQVRNSAGQAVTQVTDGNTATAWTKVGTSAGVDLTLDLYGATVGEIWIRNGYCYSQNYYSYYGRPDTVAVTLWYLSGRVNTSVTYRYRMDDLYQPYQNDEDWQGGYQRLLLPKKYAGVSRIELTVESTISGYGTADAAITDLYVTAGQHATATPAGRVTATPRPHMVYITPSPSPTSLVEFLTPRPTKTPLVEFLTPRPTATSPVEFLTPRPTQTPLVEFITPAPTPVQYPSAGLRGRILKTLATRSGPSNYYDEPGSFLSIGDEVNVISKAWDSENELWWYQVEFFADKSWYRAYTTGYRIDVDQKYVPAEPTEYESHEILEDTSVYFGPGEQFKRYGRAGLSKGSKADVYCIEGEWAQIEYRCYGTNMENPPLRRGWVKVDVLSDYLFSW